MKPLYTISAITAILLSTSAQADDFFIKPYVGAEYQFTHIDYKDGNEDLAPQNFNAANGHIGARVHKNLGFEAGYTQSATATKDNVLGSGLDVKMHFQAVNLDALGYLPIGDGKTELIGTAGAVYTKLHSSVTGFGSSSDHETKPRFGLGAQYWISDNFNVRGIARYQIVDFDDTAKGAVTGNIGINYQF